MRVLMSLTDNDDIIVSVRPPGVMCVSKAIPGTTGTTAPAAHVLVIIVTDHRQHKHS